MFVAITLKSAAPLFIEVSVSSRKSERSWICVLGVSMSSLSTILIKWYILLFIVLLRKGICPKSNVINKRKLPQTKDDYLVNIWIKPQYITNHLVDKIQPEACKIIKQYGYIWNKCGEENCIVTCFDFQQQLHHASFLRKIYIRIIRRELEVTMCVSCLTIF